VVDLIISKLEMLLSVYEDLITSRTLRYSPLEDQAGARFVKARNARLIDRYVEIVGRLSTLLIGTFAIEMIFEGTGTWLEDTAPKWRGPG